MRLVLAISAMLLAAAGSASIPSPPRLSEGARRQIAAEEEMQALHDRLVREESDNFAGHWIENPPYRRVAFAFKTDPKETLRRYTSNPNFVARQARWSMTELEAAMEDAGRQLRARDIPLASLDADEVGNDVDIVTRLDQPEVDALLASGQLALHPAVKLTGSKPLPYPAMTPEAARLVKHFPQIRNRTLHGTRELGYGTIVLKNGCLRFARASGDGPIVLFTQETCLVVGADGRLAFIDRATGQTKARVDEPLALSGGAGRGEISDPNLLAPIRAACGPGPVTLGGWFESRAAFEARMPR